MPGFQWRLTLRPPATRGDVGGAGRAARLSRADDATGPARLDGAFPCRASRQTRRPCTSPGCAPAAAVPKDAPVHGDESGSGRRAAPTTASFPHGVACCPTTPTSNVTYSRRSELSLRARHGGLHTRQSDSPYGVRRSVQATSHRDDHGHHRRQPRSSTRGGAYYWDKRSARATNREPMEPALRFPTLGLRVCADL